VDVADSVLELRKPIDKLTKTKGSRAGAPLYSYLKSSPPFGKFDMFQVVVSRVFETSTGRKREWVPPPLALPNFNSWTGIIDRLELVRIGEQVVDVHGFRLADVQVEYMVKIYESIDVSMSKDNWDSAFRCCIELIRRFPNFALAYWKAGLIILAEAVAGIKQATQNLHQGRSNGAVSTQNGAANEEQILSNYSDQSTIQSEHPSRASNAQIIPKTIANVAQFWRCCSMIERNNRHLSGLMDLSLRLCNSVFVPRASKYRDPSLYPRSLGDAYVFALIEDTL